ncbi:hypothetical protein POM88_041875 [Heracleum sosnowskyi]|uniref:Uncharacterized protein n=1 Tax=Heracleum sosnowskyi TaxID=360622 RepID=A0AAD8HH84_9APIA|nr:hypothetical protein POM88_041875 [Heracleum sosnowskyi]
MPFIQLWQLEALLLQRENYMNYSTPLSTDKKGILDPLMEIDIQMIILTNKRVGDFYVLQVKEKRAELEKLKSTFVRRASEFLGNYFASLVDFMISDKSYFSQPGQLKRPDNADLRYKCRTYARILQHLKSLDKNCLGPLTKAY